MPLDPKITEMHRALYSQLSNSLEIPHLMGVFENCDGLFFTLSLFQY